MIVERKDEDDRTLEEHTKLIFNRADRNLKFDMELPTEGKRLAFLDVDMDIIDEKIEYRWYMKEMHSGNYMTWQGHGSYVCKKNFVINRFACIKERCNTDRAMRISMYRITELLIRAGYPLDHILEWAKLGLNKAANIVKEPWEEKTKNKSIMKLPYISDECNYNIKKQIKSINMEVELVNNKYKRIRALNKYPVGFNKTKCGCETCEALPEGQVCDDCRVVYEIQCLECANTDGDAGVTYVGKANTTLGVRMRKHISDVKTQRGSALTDHIKGKHAELSIRNPTEFYNSFKIEILNKEESCVDNHIKEACTINKKKPKMNRKEEKEDWEVPIVVDTELFGKCH